MNVTITSRFIRRAIAFQIFAAVIFAVLSLIASYLLLVAGRDVAMGFVPEFYSDYEANIPSWYSANLILFNAVLLGFIAWLKKQESDRFYKHWAGLALIFVFLSMDEIASVHNLLDAPVRSLFHTTGILYLAWVVPYAIVSLAVAITYFEFLGKVPKRFALLFLVSGAFYIFSALGMEMLEAPIAEKYGFQNMRFAIFSTVEESLEMLAMTLFNYSLLSYILEFVGAADVSGESSRSVPFRTIFLCEQGIAARNPEQN